MSTWLVNELDWLILSFEQEGISWETSLLWIEFRYTVLTNVGPIHVLTEYMLLQDNKEFNRRRNSSDCLFTVMQVWTFIT